MTKFCSPLLNNHNLVFLREILGGFLASAQRFGDRFVAVALSGEEAEFSGFFGVPGLFVAFEMLFAHDLPAFLHALWLSNLWPFFPIVGLAKGATFLWSAR
jgi:hypothetical protein